MTFSSTAAVLYYKHKKLTDDQQAFFIICYTIKGYRLNWKHEKSKDQQYQTKPI